MRIGTPTFIAAFALLCVGMASTRHSIWENPYSEIKVPLNMNGVHTVDITGTPSAFIQFRSKDAANISYNERDSSETNLQKPDVSVQNGVMSIHFDPKGYVSPSIVLPTNLRLIKSSGANFEAVNPIDSLRIETSNPVQWQGDARKLEIVSLGGESASYESIDVIKGRIEQLEVTSEHAQINLGDSKTFQSISIRAGEDVSLRVSNAMDFKRIVIEPLAASDVQQISE